LIFNVYSGTMNSIYEQYIKGHFMLHDFFVAFN